VGTRYVVKQHFKNVKTVDIKAGEVHEKLEKYVIKQPEVVKEQPDKPMKVVKKSVEM
jgi:phage-related protein